MKSTRTLALCASAAIVSYSAIQAEISVSDDHLIVARRVTQNTTDNGSLEPMVDQVKLRCGAPAGGGAGRQWLLLHQQS
jgi:hypothetical protein